MAVQSNFFPITTSGQRIFTSTKIVQTKRNIAVWKQLVSDDSWELVSTSDYDLVTNSAVFRTGFNPAEVSQVEVRVADSEDELGTSLSDIALVASLKDSINIVANVISSGTPLGGGQLAGGGIIKPLIYTSKVVTENTKIVNGMNVLAIDSIDIANGVTLTLEDEVVMKVV